MEVDKELLEWSVQYRLKSYKYVGELIDAFSKLEFQIEYYLLEYFNLPNQKSHKMKSFIIDRLSFEAKRTAFKAMLDEQSINSGFIKTNSNSWPNSKLLEEIRKLQNERNYFAHYPSIVPLKINDTIITLVEDRDKTRLIEYDIMGFYDIIERMENAAKKVSELSDKHLGGAK